MTSEDLVEDMRRSIRSVGAVGDGERQGGAPRQGGVDPQSPFQPFAPGKILKSSRNPSWSYVVLEKLGQGGYGEVWKCVRRHDLTVVAVKLINLEKHGGEQWKLDVSTTVREVTLLRMVTEAIPDLTPRLHESFVLKKGGGFFLFIVLDFIDGLGCDRILEEGALPEHLAALIIRDAAEALRRLHGAGLMHRDVKAANLLIDWEGKVKICDFGVSEIILPGRRRGTFTGTPFWMAPEVIRREGYNEKADVWSLGVTAVELVRGVPPLAEVFYSNPLQFLVHMAEGNRAGRHFSFDENWTGELMEFLMEALREDPDYRPDCAGILEQEWIQIDKEEEGESREQLAEVVESIREASRNRGEEGVYRTTRAPPPLTRSEGGSRGGGQKDRLLGLLPSAGDGDGDGMAGEGDGQAGGTPRLELLQDPGPPSACVGGLALSPLESSRSSPELLQRVVEASLSREQEDPHAVIQDESGSAGEGSSEMESLNSKLSGEQSKQRGSVQSISRTRRSTTSRGGGGGGSRTPPARDSGWVFPTFSGDSREMNLHLQRQSVSGGDGDSNRRRSSPKKKSVAAVLLALSDEEGEPEDDGAEVEEVWNPNREGGGEPEGEEEEEDEIERKEMEVSAALEVLPPSVAAALVASRSSYCLIPSLGSPSQNRCSISSAPAAMHSLRKHSQNPATRPRLSVAALLSAKKERRRTTMTAQNSSTRGSINALAHTRALSLPASKHVSQTVPRKSHRQENPSFLPQQNPINSSNQREAQRVSVQPDQSSSLPLKEDLKRMSGPPAGIPPRLSTSNPPYAFPVTSTQTGRRFQTDLTGTLQAKQRKQSTENRSYSITSLTSSHRRRQTAPSQWASPRQMRQQADYSPQGTAIQIPSSPRSSIPPAPSGTFSGDVSSRKTVSGPFLNGPGKRRQYRSEENQVIFADQTEGGRRTRSTPADIHLPEEADRSQSNQPADDDAFHRGGEGMVRAGSVHSRSALAPSRSRSQSRQSQNGSLQRLSLHGHLVPLSSNIGSVVLNRPPTGEFGDKGDGNWGLPEEVLAGERAWQQKQAAVMAAASPVSASPGAVGLTSFFELPLPLALHEGEDEGHLQQEEEAEGERDYVLEEYPVDDGSTAMMVMRQEEQDEEDDDHAETPMSFDVVTKKRVLPFNGDTKQQSRTVASVSTRSQLGAGSPSLSGLHSKSNQHQVLHSKGKGGASMTLGRDSEWTTEVISTPRFVNPKSPQLLSTPRGGDHQDLIMSVWTEEAEANPYPKTKKRHVTEEPRVFAPPQRNQSNSLSPRNNSICRTEAWEGSGSGQAHRLSGAEHSSELPPCRRTSQPGRPVSVSGGACRGPSASVSGGTCRGPSVFSQTNSGEDGDVEEGGVRLGGRRSVCASGGGVLHVEEEEEEQGDADGEEEEKEERRTRSFRGDRKDSQNSMGKERRLQSVSQSQTQSRSHSRAFSAVGGPDKSQTARQSLSAAAAPAVRQRKSSGGSHSLASVPVRPASVGDAIPSVSLLRHNRASVGASIESVPLRRDRASVKESIESVPLRRDRASVRESIESVPLRRDRASVRESIESVPLRRDRASVRKSIESVPLRKQSAGGTFSSVPLRETSLSNSLASVPLRTPSGGQSITSVPIRNVASSAGGGTFSSVGLRRRVSSQCHPALASGEHGRESHTGREQKRKSRSHEYGSFHHHAEVQEAQEEEEEEEREGGHVVEQGEQHGLSTDPRQSVTSERNRQTARRSRDSVGTLKESQGEEERVIEDKHSHKGRTRSLVEEPFEHAPVCSVSEREEQEEEGEETDRYEGILEESETNTMRVPLPFPCRTTVRVVIKDERTPPPVVASAPPPALPPSQSAQTQTSQQEQREPEKENNTQSHKTETTPQRDLDDADASFCIPPPPAPPHLNSPGLSPPPKPHPVDALATQPPAACYESVYVQKTTPPGRNLRRSRSVRTVTPPSQREFQPRAIPMQPMPPISAASPPFPSLAPTGGFSLSPCPPPPTFTCLPTGTHTPSLPLQNFNGYNWGPVVRPAPYIPAPQRPLTVVQPPTVSPSPPVPIQALTNPLAPRPVHQPAWGMHLSYGCTPVRVPTGAPPVQVHYSPPRHPLPLHPPTTALSAVCRWFTSPPQTAGTGAAVVRELGDPYPSLLEERGSRLGSGLVQRLSGVMSHSPPYGNILSVPQRIGSMQHSGGNAEVTFRSERFPLGLAASGGGSGESPVWPATSATRSPSGGAPPRIHSSRQSADFCGRGGSGSVHKSASVGLPSHAAEAEEEKEAEAEEGRGAEGASRLDPVVSDENSVAPHGESFLGSPVGCRIFLPAAVLVNSGGRCATGEAALWVDPSRREEYLHPSDFKELLGVSPQKFRRLPVAERQRLKRLAALD